MLVHSYRTSLAQFIRILVRPQVCAYEDRPTGFHLIIPLNKEVSCSSVHASIGSSVPVCSTLTGVRGSDARGGTSSASPEGVEAALVERRAFFLGGIVVLTVVVRYENIMVTKDNLTAIVIDRMVVEGKEVTCAL